LPGVSPKRRRVRTSFALFAVLAILALFVFDGAAGGVAALAAMLVFIAACVNAMRGEDVNAVAHSGRTGLAGWFRGQ
jgi:hypothetical protein